MTLYFVAIHRSDDYDPPRMEDAQMGRDIDRLNDEMVTAGIRRFVGGLQPPQTARALRLRSNGEVSVTDGPYLETKEQIGGFWVLEVADLASALEWGRRAAIACRASVEVRPFH